MTHDYQAPRHPTLFAALNVLEGKVIGRCMQRHRHQEFIRFLMPSNAKCRPTRRSTGSRTTTPPQAPKVTAWLTRHQCFTFHFTPTSLGQLPSRACALPTRRVEFLHFMNRVVVDHPIIQAARVHVILDNLNTHRPKHDRWLGRHKNIHFHFTPTHASWLNQVEVWFFHPLQPRLGRRQLHLPTAGARSDRRFHYRIQSGRSPLRVDQAGRLLETPAIFIR